MALIKGCIAAGMAPIAAASWAKPACGGKHMLRPSNLLSKHFYLVGQKSKAGKWARKSD
jgi:hypothetical protein